MTRQAWRLVATVALNLTLGVFGFDSHGADSNARAKVPRSVIHRSDASLLNQGGSAASAALVDQAIRMLHGGIETAVVQRFVQTWAVPFLTSAEDLERLRSAGAPISLLDAYARRGAELRLQVHLHPSRSSKNGEPPQITVLTVPAPSTGSRWLATRSQELPLYPFSNELPWLSESYAYRYEWASGYFGPVFSWPP